MSGELHRIGPRAVAKLRRLFWLLGSDPGWLELWSAWVAIYWGAVLLLPFETFGSPQSTQFYKTLSDAASEDAWGAIFLAVGAIQWLSLSVKRTWLSWPANSLACGLFAVLAFSIWLAAPYTASPGIHGTIALSMWYATWYRIRWGYGP